MNFKEILIFDISGEYGHFRKYNTTTSPLTYSIPTRTAIAGIIGAVLGMERELQEGVFPENTIPVQEFFSRENSNIAVQILNPVKKVTIGLNLINTKTSFYDLSKAGRTQIPFEFVKNPKYRIFVSFDDKVRFEELKERLKKKKFHFSPYLGLAQLTATLEFVAEAKAEYRQNKNGDFVEIITAVNLSKIEAENPVKFDYSAMYSVNNMPLIMDRNREIQEYGEILIEKNGKTVNARAKDYFFVENFGNIMFV